MSGGVDVTEVSNILRQLLIDAERPIILQDSAGGEEVIVPPDAAAAPDGLLPMFLSTGEAIALEAFNEGFGLELTRDRDALFSLRVTAIGARTLSQVMLTTMEAIAQASTPRGIMVIDLSRVHDEAMSRHQARKAQS